MNCSPEFSLVPWIVWKPSHWLTFHSWRWSREQWRSSQSLLGNRNVLSGITPKIGWKIGVEPFPSLVCQVEQKAGLWIKATKLKFRFCVGEGGGVGIERGKRETGSLRVGSQDPDVRSIDQEKWTQWGVESSTTVEEFRKKWSSFWGEVR